MIYFFPEGASSCYVPFDSPSKYIDGTYNFVVKVQLTDTNDNNNNDINLDYKSFSFDDKISNYILDKNNIHNEGDNNCTSPSKKSNSVDGFFSPIPIDKEGFVPLDLNSISNNNNYWVVYAYNDVIQLIFSNIQRLNRDGDEHNTNCGNDCDNDHDVAFDNTDSVYHNNILCYEDNHNINFYINNDDNNIYPTSDATSLAPCVLFSLEPTSIVNNFDLDRDLVRDNTHTVDGRTHTVHVSPNDYNIHIKNIYNNNCDGHNIYCGCNNYDEDDNNHVSHNTIQCDSQLNTNNHDEYHIDLHLKH